MYNLFGETLANEWTPKTVCESRADWLKFEDLSNGDQLDFHNGGRRADLETILHGDEAKKASRKRKSVYEGFTYTLCGLTLNTPARSGPLTKPFYRT